MASSKQERLYVLASLFIAVSLLISAMAVDILTVVDWTSDGVKVERQCGWNEMRTRHDKGPWETTKYDSKCGSGGENKYCKTKYNGEVKYLLLYLSTYFFREIYEHFF